MNKSFKRILATGCVLTLLSASGVVTADSLLTKDTQSNLTKTSTGYALGITGKTEQELKAQVNTNLNIIKDIEDKVREEKSLTGIAMYTKSDMTNLEKAYFEIANIQNYLITKSEGKEQSFVHTTYPLVSEFMHWGLNNGYSESYYLNPFFEQQKDYKDDVALKLYDEVQLQEETSHELTLADISRVGNVTGRGVFKNLVIRYTPYQMRASGEHHIYGTKDNPRYEIHLNPKGDYEQLSTLIHEMGHKVYSEHVEHNKALLTEYKSLYRNTLKSGAEYVWTERLEETFAEDYKLYIAYKILNGTDETLKDLVIANLDDFTINETTNTYSNKHLPSKVKYFNKLPREKTNKTFGSQISIKLSDYLTEVLMSENHSKGNHLSKLYTKGKFITITHDGKTYRQSLKYGMNEIVINTLHEQVVYHIYKQ